MKVTPQQLYNEHAGRRKGIIRALTTEVEQFYAQCDPSEINLCLYAYPDGTWKVDKPVDDVPPAEPEPVVGINFARDGMQRGDWLALVAVHSDSWLLSLSYFKGARLDREGRDMLFQMINDQPTCFEVISGRANASHAGTSGMVYKQEDMDGGGEGEGDPCPMCGRHYREDEFWIACDGCDVWYCGKCARMTEAKSQKVKDWRCHKCT